MRYLAHVLLKGSGPFQVPYPPPLGTLYPTTYTLHPTPYTLRLAPYTIHPTPCTLHPTPCALHPTPFTLHISPFTPPSLSCTLPLHPAPPGTLHRAPETKEHAV